MHICALRFFPVELSTIYSLRARAKWVEISLHRPHLSGCGRGEDLLSGQVYRRPERAVPGPALSHRRLQSASFWKEKQWWGPIILHLRHCFDVVELPNLCCSKQPLNILNCLTRYGYVTNTKVKFVIVVDSSNTSLRDNEIRSVSWS